MGNLCASVPKTADNGSVGVNGKNITAKQPKVSLTTWPLGWMTLECCVDALFLAIFKRVEMMHACCNLLTTHTRDSHSNSFLIDYLINKLTMYFLSVCVERANQWNGWLKQICSSKCREQSHLISIFAWSGLNIERSIIVTSSWLKCLSSLNFFLRLINMACLFNLIILGSETRG